ncbi:hypothetical protein [Vibrio harveyi]|uniref:hypothetical protein n=1 Tax=Vibrio harveyi TaxID=669 RepID=UPI0018F197FF|nr:hypothetical protein [Vibrio harveyi]
MSNGKQTVSYRLDKSLVKQIETLSFQYGLTKTQTVADLLTNSIQQLKKSHPATFTGEKSCSDSSRKSL